MERGLNVLVLDRSIWTKEKLSDIKLVSDVDNNDQVTCMGDHEMRILMKMMSLTKDQSYRTLWLRV